MAFTLQSYIADPTLITGNARLPTFVSGPTLITGNARLPTFIADPTATLVSTKFPSFIADPTLVMGGRLPLYIAAPPLGDKGKYVTPQGFTKTETGVQGSVGAPAKTRAYATKVMTGYSSPAKSLQKFTKVMSGVTGVVSSFSLGKTLQPLVKNMRSDPFGVMGKQVYYFDKTMAGAAGAIGSSLKTFQALNSTKGGYVQITGQMAKTLRLFGKATAGTISIGGNYFTITMHTERQAYTTYTNYQFNSFAKFNDVYLGATSGGLFALTGGKDDGVNIDAVARVGITDFGTSKEKKVDRMYIGYRTNGEMILRVMTDEIHVRDYLIPYSGKTGLHTQRARIGKGLIARYWQFELQNRDGSDFELNTMEFKPVVLSRRFGGGRA